jgi:hypothetical protein
MWSAVAPEAAGVSNNMSFAFGIGLAATQAAETTAQAIRGPAMRLTLPIVMRRSPFRLIDPLFASIAR